MTGRNDDFLKSRRTAVWIAIALGSAILIAGVVVAQVSVEQRVDFELPFDVDPDSAVATAIAADSAGRSDADNRLLAGIAEQPTATWLASPNRSIEADVRDIVDAAADRSALPVLVAYNIPGRDCGSYSASDVEVDANSYGEWITNFAEGLDAHKAIVIVEPDALAQLDCLDAEGRTARLELLRQAVATLTATGSWVYLDAGHSGWHPTEEMADRLESAGIADAAGFSLNVSNFRSTEDETAYGTEISNALAEPAHFVIDTSRNGVEATDREWCNPPGRALGAEPTADTDDPLVDALLWIKTPGFSDGECAGGPGAGEWFGEYALDLARTAEAVSG
jgi:endoglucanase